MVGVVMGKLPRPGATKTRLCPPLSPEQAAQVHAMCLGQTLSWLAGDDRWDRVVWSFAGGSPDEAAEFRECVVNAGRVELHEQGGGDLGRRLADVADTLGRPSIAFFGADTPHLRPDRRDAVAVACRRNQPAIGPCDDGGFWTLVTPAGLDLHEPLLDIDWSSGRECGQVQDRFAQDRHPLALLPDFWDVDRPDDLARLAAADAAWFRTIPDVLAVIGEST
ncbi:MAG: DUF2064 domain-containing protein [Planctomycetota bacterium]